MFMAKMALLSRLCLLGAGTFLFFWCAPPNVEAEFVCFPTSAKSPYRSGRISEGYCGIATLGLEFAVVFPG